jgi:hypothetical protein
MVAIVPGRSIVFLGSWAVNVGSETVSGFPANGRRLLRIRRGRRILKRKKLRKPAVTTYVLLAAVVLGFLVVIYLSQ